MDIDPEIAASMGFASFGTQANAKKRKFNPNDAVVDVSSNPAATEGHGQGQPRQQIPSRPISQPDPAGSTTKEDAVYASLQGKKLEELDDAELNALRQGVRNEAGDLVFFKPSFVEDPWARLTK